MVSGSSRAPAATRPLSVTPPRQRLRWTHGLINRLVMGADLALLCLAPLGLAALAGAGPLTAAQVIVLVALQAAVFLWVMAKGGFYRVEFSRAAWPAGAQILLALTAAAAAAALLLAAFAPEALRSGGVMAWLGAQFGGLTAGRLVAMGVLRRPAARGLLQRNVVVIGANPLGVRIVQDHCSPQRSETDRVVAVYRDETDDPACEVVGGLAVAGGIEDFLRDAPGLDPDVVMLALPWARDGAVARLSAQVERFAADVVVPTMDQGARPGHARLVPFGEGTALQVMSKPLKGSMYIAKQVEDYVIATLALLVTSPVLLLAAIAIRLESPGPVLFRQPRTGFGREPFMIFKLRTMTYNPADDGSVGATGRNDPRITRVGAFLRRTSIDELPQFLNVLRGEMSVVGPRPYPVRMLLGEALFSERIQRYAARYRIKPGLTGFAQVSGLRSNALRDPWLAQRSVELDIEYINNWSLWLDLKIILRTVLFSLRGRHVF